MIPMLTLKSTTLPTTSPAPPSDGLPGVGKPGELREGVPEPARLQMDVDLTEGVRTGLSLVLCVLPKRAGPPLPPQRMAHECTSGRRPPEQSSD